MYCVPYTTAGRGTDILLGGNPEFMGRLKAGGLLRTSTRPTLNLLLLLHVSV